MPLGDQMLDVVKSQFVTKGIVMYFAHKKDFCLVILGCSMTDLPNHDYVKTEHQPYNYFTVQVLIFKSEAYDGH